MGRPLKIAKAQAVLTITATNGTTEVVTVSQNLSTLGVIAGMPFIPASTVGGLTGGTTYWILQVLSTTTFTVSATQLSANPTFTPVNLSSAGPVTVAATVGLVDSGFNNPNNSNTSAPTGSNESFGVVGGNTALYGKQVLANIAIGVAGTGTVFASTGSDIVAGYGTDFANITTGTTLYALWGDGTGTPMILGVASSTHGDLTVAVANTQNTGNIIGTTGNAQTLVEGAPVTFTANLGGLVTGTTYWVLNVANSSAFTVSLTPGGAEVDLSSATGTPDAVQQQVVLNANSANNATGVNGYGDGYVTALHEAGFILRQKGKTKYLVQGATSGLIGACYTANVANAALEPNTMCVIATYDDASTQFVSSLNDYQSEVFPEQVDAANLTIDGTTVYTIYSSGDTDWTAIGAAGNITGISFIPTVAGSGTGTAILSDANPDVIATFNTAYAANTYPGVNPVDGQTSLVSGQPNPIVVINNA